MFKNTPKQDRTNVRTATGLERKYNFGNQSEKVESAMQSAEQASSNLSELENSAKSQFKELNEFKNSADAQISTLNEFKASAEEQLAELNSGVRNCVQTWVYSREPSLSNAPANEWLTDDEKNEHIGDFYFDTVAKKFYVFINTGNSYAWVYAIGSEELYNITFYDSDEVVIATYSIKQGDSIKPPIENVNWVDEHLNPVTFPFTPTADTIFYLWN